MCSGKRSGLKFWIDFSRFIAFVDNCNYKSKLVHIVCVE